MADVTNSYMTEKPTSHSFFTRFSACRWALFMVFVASTYAQVRVDTIVTTPAYKSYFSYTLREPLYVTYTLYKGGGDCDRDGMRFDECGVNTATDDDYDKAYDKGHLANAEDFAYDCDLDRATFCYYNCLPQVPRLNRGIWKTWETQIRKLSQKKRLFIVAGGIFGTKTYGPNRIGVPDYCYKIVYEADTRKVLYCLLFPNDTSKSYKEVTLAELKQKVGYTVDW